MKCALFAAAVLGAVSFTALPAHADGTCPPASGAPATWGAPAAPSSTADESPVARARDLLARARLLDEAATSDERSAVEIAARLPTLRASAKAARDRADRAAGDDREALVSRAEDLETDLAVSEAETTAKRRSAVDNRRVAQSSARGRCGWCARRQPIRRQRQARRATRRTGSPPTAGRSYRVECLK